MSRKAKLKKALAPRPSDERQFQIFGIKEGIFYERARLATLHEALVAAVEAIEWIKPILHGEELQHAEDVLSNIDKVLEEK